MRFLTEHYQEIIASHDCINLVKLIKAVYSKRNKNTKNDRKPGQIDERFLKRAEDMLFGELAVALDIPRDQVVSYIESTIAAINAGEDWNG